MEVKNPAIPVASEESSFRPSSHPSSCRLLRPVFHPQAARVWFAERPVQA